MSKTCNHTRVLTLNAKADDRQNFSVPHLDLEHDGYAPHITGLCGGDYIELTVCFDCGHVVGFEPMDDEEIAAVFEEA
jgi:hypothetical protein